MRNFLPIVVALGCAASAAAQPARTTIAHHRVGTVVGTTFSLGTVSVGKVTELVFNDGGCIEYLVVQDTDGFVVVPWALATINYEQKVVTVQSTAVTVEKLRELRFSGDRWPNFSDQAYARQVQAVWGASATRPGVATTVPMPKTKDIPVSPGTAGLVELRTKATEHIALPAQVAGQPPEAVAVIRASVDARRWAWVVDRVRPTPPPPPPPSAGLPGLKLGDLHVGDAGTVDAMCTVVRVEDGTLVLQPPDAEATPFAATGIDTGVLATGHKVRVNGVYEAYKTAKFGDLTVVVIRAKAAKAAPAPDPQRDALHVAAVAEHRKAVAALDETRAAHARAFAAVKAKVEADAKAEAKRLVPQPDDDPGAFPTNDEISQAREKRAATERRLVKEAMERLEKVWAVPAE